MQLGMYKQYFYKPLFNDYNNKMIEFIIYDKKYNFNNITHTVQKTLRKYIEDTGKFKIYIDVNRHLKLNKKFYKKQETFFINGSVKALNKKYNEKNIALKKYGVLDWDIIQQKVILLFIPVENIKTGTITINDIKINYNTKRKINFTEKRRDNYRHKIGDIKYELNKLSSLDNKKTIKLANELIKYSSYIERLEIKTLKKNNIDPTTKKEGAKNGI